MKYQLEVANRTHIGLVREINEDAYIIDKELGLFIVADGMGGHKAGEIASNLAVNAIYESLKKGNKKIETRLKKSIEEANTLIWEKAQFEAEKEGMGTTIVSLLFTEKYVHLAYVGDSRAYHFSNNKLTKLTKDHSLVQELIDRKIISEEEARNSAIKHIITHCLGAGPKLEIGYSKILYKKGDIFLTCSDGLTDELSDSEIEKELKKTSNLEQIIDNLINNALRNGGNDNITAILIRVKK